MFYTIVLLRDVITKRHARRSSLVIIFAEGIFVGDIRFSGNICFSLTPQVVLWVQE